MDLSEIGVMPGASLGDTSTLPTAPMPAVSAAAPTHQLCDECAAPVDSEQRYCVSCGAHRRNVNDPATRYLSQATARSRTSRAIPAGKRSRRASGGVGGLGVALLLALIPAVAAFGVLVGRSSNNQDAKLIQALTRHQAAQASGGAASTSTVTSPGAATAVTKHTGAHGTKAKKKSSGKASSAKSGHKANATTQYGSVSQIAGSKATKAQEQQGAQDTQKVQKSTGKTYVNGQSSLPGTVVVP